MRLNSNSYFEHISREQLIHRLHSLNESFNETENLHDLRGKLKTYERTRCLQVWHDGSVIINHGHILFCVNLMYDPAVFDE